MFCNRESPNNGKFSGMQLRRLLNYDNLIAGVNIWTFCRTGEYVLFGNYSIISVLLTRYYHSEQR